MDRNPVLFIAAGMPRSASTWLYNAVRLVLDAHPAVNGNFGCGWIEDWESIPKKQYLLIKMHQYDDLAACHSRAVFYSYRDIRDAIASQCRRFGGCPDLNWAYHYVDQHERWMQRATFTMKYEDMIRDQQTVVYGIESAIAINNLLPPLPIGKYPRPERLLRHLSGLSYASRGERNGDYHKTNLYHRDHITDGRIGSWRGWLDDDLAAQITEEYRWWFDKYGYDTDLAPRAGLEPATK